MKALRDGPDLTGTPLSSAELRRTNRVLVVNVWGSWCGPCRREAPVLSAVSKKYAKRGVAFLGLLSRDKPAAASAFVRRFDLNYPSLQDPGGRLQLKFAHTLPSQGIPTTWIIDRHGRVAARVLVEVTKPTLVGLIDEMNKDVIGIILGYAAQIPHHLMEENIAQHEDILAALAARDSAGAKAAMRNHILRTTDIFLNWLESQSE